MGICPDCGIFTQTLGTPPNRQFVIRWKTTYFNHPGHRRVRGPTDRRLGYAVGDLWGERQQRREAASGIQQDLTRFTSFSCAEAGPDTAVCV